MGWCGEVELVGDEHKRHQPVLCSSKHDPRHAHAHSLLVKHVIQRHNTTIGNGAGSKVEVMQSHLQRVPAIDAGSRQSATRSRADLSRLAHLDIAATGNERMRQQPRGAARREDETC